MEVAIVTRCFEVEVWAATEKFTNVIVAGFRKCRDLVGEGKVFIKNKAKVASRVGCSERRVNSSSWTQTRSSAIAERPRDASCC